MKWLMAGLGVALIVVAVLWWREQTQNERNAIRIDQVLADSAVFQTRDSTQRAELDRLRDTITARTDSLAALTADAIADSITTARQLTDLHTILRDTATRNVDTLRQQRDAVLAVIARQQSLQEKTWQLVTSQKRQLATLQRALTVEGSRVEARDRRIRALTDTLLKVRKTIPKRKTLLHKAAIEVGKIVIWEVVAEPIVTPNRD